MSWYKGLESIVKTNVPLAPFTWFRLGGPAQYFAEPRTEEELKEMVRRCAQENIAVRVLGGGSNILVRDEGVSGLVIHLSDPAFSGITVQGGKVVAGGGAKLGHVISTSVREGLSGLETLVGIPGTIGGALHGNAGTRVGDIGQWTCRATVMSRKGEIIQRERDDLVFAYRQSSLNELVILRAEFQLEPDDRDELTKRMQKLWIVKKANQPMSHQPTGCIFKNPRGVSAGMLIEQSSLKGARSGGAEVSDRHANFIVVSAEAKARDVLNLIQTIKDRVLQRMGVELEVEIDVW